MTDANWDDFLAPDPAAVDDVVDNVLDAVVDAVAEAVTGGAAATDTWDEWTATGADVGAADAAVDTSAEEPSSVEEVGDLATAEADAELSIAANEISEGNLAGAYDAVGNAQGFTDVASDAYSADTSFETEY